MKVIVSLFFVFMSVLGFGQSSLDDLANKKVAWVGVDFSLGKFLGKDGFPDLQKIKDSYFSEWNRLTINEQKKNLTKMMGLKELAVFVDPVMANNNAIKITNYVQNDPHRVDEEGVKSTVKSYDLSQLEADVGAVFFVEFFSKQLGAASIYFTLFEKESKEVFFIKKIKSSPQGMGIRNYWMGCIKDTISSINKNWKKWKKGKE